MTSTATATENERERTKGGKDFRSAGMPCKLSWQLLDGDEAFGSGGMASDIKLGRLGDAGTIQRYGLEDPMDSIGYVYVRTDKHTEPDIWRVVRKTSHEEGEDCDRIKQELSDRADFKERFGEVAFDRLLRSRDLDDQQRARLPDLKRHLEERIRWSIPSAQEEAIRILDQDNLIPMDDLVAGRKALIFQYYFDEERAIYLKTIPELKARYEEIVNAIVGSFKGPAPHTEQFRPRR